MRSEVRHRVVLLDVDGTLQNSDGRLPEIHRLAVASALRCGVRVALATGKSPESIIGLHRTLGLDTPMVCSQGTLVCSADGSVIASTVIEPSDLSPVLDFLEGEGLEAVAYAGRQLHAEYESCYTHHLHRRYDEPVVIAPTSLRALGEARRVNKLLVRAPDRPDRLLRNRVAVAVGHLVGVTQAVSDTFEVLPLGVNKAEGVRRLLAELDLTFDDALAIGDGGNDLELIVAARTGIAMGNAVAELRAAADHIVASNDRGGVAEALERFL